MALLVMVRLSDGHLDTFILRPDIVTTLLKFDSETEINNEHVSDTMFHPQQYVDYWWENLGGVRAIRTLATKRWIQEDKVFVNISF